MSTLNWGNVGEREQLKGREVKDISIRKNSFRENIKIEEYRKHVGGMANRRVKQGMGCMGWRNGVEDKVFTLNDRVL